MIIGNNPSRDTTVAPTGKSAIKDNQSPIMLAVNPSAHPKINRIPNVPASNDALNPGMIKKANTSSMPAMLTANVITIAKDAKNKNSQTNDGRLLLPSLSS